MKVGFTCKARCVLDCHTTPDLVRSTYIGVVSHKSVRTDITCSLNNFDVFATNKRNTYLYADSSQKYYIICGLEFGLKIIGNVSLIHITLYGGRNAAHDFKRHGGNPKQCTSIY